MVYDTFSEIAVLLCEKQSMKSNQLRLTCPNMCSKVRLDIFFNHTFSGLSISVKNGDKQRKPIGCNLYSCEMLLILTAACFSCEWISVKLCVGRFITGFLLAAADKLAWSLKQWKCNDCAHKRNPYRRAFHFAAKVTQLKAGKNYSHIATLGAHDAYGNKAWLVQDYNYLDHHTLEGQNASLVHVSE